MLDLTKKWALRESPTVEVIGLRIAEHATHPVETAEACWTAEGSYWVSGEESRFDLVPLQYLRSGPLHALALTAAHLTLPTDSAERKNVPLNEGLFKYFPAALAGVAKHSQKGNDKHNPGEPLHHARGKSGDHGDCILRHVMDLNDMLAGYERLDNVPVRSDDPLILKITDEVHALCWRALALSQELHERFGAPLAPGAKL